MNEEPLLKGPSPLTQGLLRPSPPYSLIAHCSPSEGGTA